MDPTRLPAHEHCPLQDPGQDIRIVEVLPGEFDDSIRVQIHHVSITEPLEVADTRMTMPQLKATLPEGWELYRNHEGRYFFRNCENDTYTWEHPGPGVDKATYELPPYAKLDSHYEALSYAWGSDQKPHHLIVDGEHGCTRLPVTDSLMTALRHLRRPDESRKLWIDAVCINQSDHVELGSQVRRMGLIYKLAYRVVVWLGPQSDGSAHALATLSYLGAQVEVGEGHGRLLFRAPFAEEPTWHDPRVALPYSQDTWDSILSLLQRPWFYRVWVVQEIQLGGKRPGPIFQCGTDTIKLSNFFRAVMCFFSTMSERKLGEFPFWPNEITDVTRMIQPIVGADFGTVLRFGTIDRLCKDSRDKVYGTIGLLPNGFASKIKADYGRDNTASQVYKKTFVTHAQHVGRLELFKYCYIAESFIPNAPSWVPDWSSMSSSVSWHTDQVATGASRAHLKYTDEEPDLLEVLGVSCAVVSHVSDYLQKGIEKQIAVDRVRQWQPRDLDTAIYRPTGETLRKAYACTLIEKLVATRSLPLDDIPIDKWVEQAGDESLFGDFTICPGGSEADKSEGMGRAVKSALNLCGGRAFIQTHEGYIGLAPADTRPGDVVAIFLGCSNPLVLRPEQGRYSVVGDSFVYGLDDAAKLLGPIPEPWRVRVERISLGRSLHYFFDPRTGETTREDPRLEPLHKWSRVDRKPDGDDPINFDFFENEETGIVVNYDPRLEPEMLEKRGVQLERFVLV